MSIRNFIKRTQLLLDQALYESRRALRTEDAVQTVNVAALEERLLMSASPVAAVASPAAAVAEAAQPETTPPATPDPVDNTVDQATQQQTLELLVDEALPAATAVTDLSSDQTADSDLAVAQTLELVFIDGSISNLDQMVADLENEDALDENRSLEIVVLDTQRDGVAQITAALLQYNGIDGVHIVSHGSGGEVKLGSTVLSLDTIDTYRSAINAWQHSFTEEADLLFYGCHLAATEDGRELMAQISGECDCDVSASEDLTGHADLGGDWDLEYQVGTISTEVVFSSQLQDSWQGVLGTINVTTTDDVLDGDADLTSLAALLATPGSDGEISLREALLAANADAGTDTISFSISDPLVNGGHTISLASALPDITDTLIINGATEPDYAANGNAPVVVLDGAATVPTGLVITATADNSEIRGLSFRGLTSHAIEINAGADGVTVVGNYIGRLATDGTDSGSGDINGAGVFVNGSNAVIGGTTAADRNVIAGVTSAIFLDGSSATGAVISGNYIGLAADGLTVIGTTSDGIRLENGAHTNTIGGATAAAGNVIAGTGRDGVRIDGSATDDNTIAGNLFGVSAAGTTRLGTSGSGVYVTGGADRTLIEDNLIAAAGTTGVTIDGSSDATRIEGNTIGTNASGTLNWGSGGDGILLTGAVTNSVIGTTTTGDGNTIVFSGQQSGDGAGISILDGATGNAVRGNAIHSNAGLGIDLAETANDGADVNDLADGDSGGNTRLNTPVLQSASLNDAGNLAVDVDLTALPVGTYSIDFYASSTLDSSVVEGERYLFSAVGLASGFSGTVNQTVAGLAPGELLTAVAVDETTLNSSEFSRHAVIVDSDTGGTAPSDLLITSASGGLQLNTDGGNDGVVSVASGNDVFDGRTALTLEVRFASTSLTAGTTFVSYTTATGDDLLRLRIADDGTGVNFTVNGSANTVNASGFDFSQLADGRDHTLTLTWNGATGAWQIFVDGQHADSGTGAGTGSLATTSASLVFGQEQDGHGRDFDTAQAFSGELHDVRVFSAVRAADDIASDHARTLPHDTSGLIANWVFDSVDRLGTITETVSGRDARLHVVRESGFTSGTPELRLEVDENTGNGTVVGRVAGIDAEREALVASLLAADPYLFYSSATGKFYQLTEVQANWATASTNAQATSLNGVAGQLATIRSAFENEYIRELAEIENLSVFIGGTDATVDGQWRWQSAGADDDAFWSESSGTSLNGAFTSWAPGQPSGTAGANGVRLEESNGLWFETPVNSVSRRSVIEWDADAVLSSAAVGAIGTQPLAYSIVSQTEAGAFAVDGVTGEIRVADSTKLDFENPPTTHSLTIRVSDSESPARTYDEVIQIHLNDVADSDSAPLAVHTGVSLNTAGGTGAYLVADDGGALLGGRTAVTAEVSFAIEQSVETSVLLSYASSASTDDLLLQVHEDGRLEFAIGGTTVALSDTDYHALLADGDRHALALTWDNTHGDWTVHLDGEQVAHGTGLHAGGTIGGAAGDGTLILGLHQDSAGGTFDAAERFSGTLYDARLWSGARTHTDIAFSHSQQLNPAALPPELIANWQMTGFDGNGDLIDEASAHVLHVAAANESAFTAGTATIGLSIEEAAVSGTVVGRVVPREPDVYADLVSDGRFLDAPTPVSIDNYNSGQSFGGWDVTAGSVSLHGPSGQRSPLGGLSVNLNGTSAGTIQQDLTTVAGVEYQVVFAASGDWTGGDAIKDLRATAGGTAVDFSLTEPGGWSSGNKLWAPRSFTFTATGASTTLQFSSLDVTGGQHGPMIADVAVYAVPPAVSQILNTDPALSYDAGTGKFYRLESSAVQFSAAHTAATSQLLNGVAGQLVTIGSEWENELVRNFVQGQGADLWIGATDGTTEGEWHWLKGSNESDQFWTGGLGGTAVNPFYENWGSGEPNNSTGLLASGEDAGVINSSGVWYDWEDDPGNQLGYLVEWDASQVLTTFHYALNDPSGNFEISDTGQITVRAGHTLDHSLNASHDVDVTVTDAVGNSHQETLTIAVTNSGAVTDSYLTAEDRALTVAAPGLLQNDSHTAAADTGESTVVSFDARTDTDGDSTWTGNTGGVSLTLAAGVTHTTSPTSPPAGLTAAFDFDGTGGGTAAALNDFSEVDSTQSGSVELWVRLDSTTPSQTLLDLGSDLDGIGLSVSGGQLILTYEDGGSTNSASVSGLSSGTWHHLVVTFDIISGSNQQARVWLDGSEVISRSYTTLSNWAGGSFGLGTVNGTAAGFANGHLAGEVASLRIHSGVLSETEIGTLSSTPGALSSLHAVVSSVNTTGTSGSVSVNADGSFTYDPNGQFAALAGGQTATDTFTYTRDDGTGNTETATVTVTIIGSGEPGVTRPATITVTEDGTHSLSAGDVIQIDDGVATDSRVRVTVSVGGGTLTAATLTDVTVLEGTNGSGRLVLEGLASRVNAALDGMIYAPFADGTGSDTLSVSLELAADLAARYSFDDSTADDHSQGISHDGQLIGGATVTTDTRGQVLNLDASGEQLQIDTVFDQPESLTVAGWVNLTAAGTRGAEFVSIGDDLILRLDDTVHGTSLWARTSTGWNILDTGTRLQGTGWRHVAATFDDSSNQQVVYIDGQAVATAAFTDSINWSGGTTTTLGAAVSGGSEFEFRGQMDEARIYTRALTAAEIAAVAAEQTTAVASTSITITAVNDAPAFVRGSGLQLADFGSGDDLAQAVAVAADGKLVVAGYAFNGTDNDFAVARFHVDGSMDTSFGGTGLVTIPIGSGLDQAWAVAIQDDGRILVAGETANGAREVALVRLLTDGTLDASYGGGDGIVTSDFGSGNDRALALTLQPDGRALISGTSGNGSDDEILLARYTTSGVLDTFGTGGFVTTSVGTADARGYAVSVRSDGRIVVGGQATVSGSEDFAVVRYLADGSLDTTFGGTGVVTTPITANADSATTLVSLDDGRLIVAGVSSDGAEDNFAIVRYTNTGAVDTTFGTAGTVISALAEDDRITSLAVAPDGSLLLTGTQGAPVQTAIFTARYSAAGVLDTTFGSSGYVVEDLSATTDDLATQIAVRPDGSFVVVGSSQSTDSDFLLLSYNADGSRQTSFATADSLTHTPTFVEGGSAAVLEPAAEILDAELAVSGYDGSHVIIERTSGASTEDVFSARGTLGALTPSGALTVGGVNIGTVAINSGGTLRLNFTGVDATQARVNLALQQIAYSNSSDTPPTSVDLTWTFSDGNDGVAQGSGAALQATGTTQVAIQAAPDLTVTAPTTVTLDEDTSTPLNGGNTIVVDTGITADTRVQVNLSVASGTLTVTPAGTVSIVGGSNASGGLVLEGLESEVNATLASLVYDPIAESSYTTSLDISLALSADLAAAYAFAGDAVDSSVGVSQDGTLNGTAGYTTDGTRGQVLQLDGSGHVSVATDFAQPATATVSGWVNLNAGAPDGVLWSVGGDLELRIDAAGGNGVTGRFHDGTQWQQTISGLDIHGDGWHHLAYAVDADNNVQILYVDGREVARTTFTGGVADITAFSGSLIGTDGSGNALVGLIDDARLHTRALSAEEIAGLATDSHEATNSVSVTVNAVNDAPVFTNLDGDVLGYTEGDGQQPIEQGGNAIISDVDSLNFSGGTLVVSFASGSDSSQDVLSIRDQGFGIGNVSVSGSTVFYSAVPVATMSGGTGGTPLTISFNLAGTPLAATMILQNVTYENTNTTSATAGVRTVNFVMSDGDGPTGVSLTATASVNVGSPNDPPVITSGAGGGTHFEGAGGTYFNNSLTVADVDSPDFDGGKLTVSVTTNGETADRLLVLDGGGVTVSGNVVSFDPGTGAVAVANFSGGDGSNPLEITFNTSADAAAVQAVAQQVAFRTDSDTPSSAQRTLRMALTDGDGGTSSAVTRTMNVVPVNDRPELDLDANDSSGSTGNDFQTIFTEGGGAVLIVDADATLTDADHANLASVTVVLTNAQESGSEEQLSADTTGTALTATWTQATDTLTISGVGTVADFQTVLRTVRYLNTSNNPETATDRLVTFVASDGTDTSLIATSTIDVRSVNNPPTVTAISNQTVNEDTATGPLAFVIGDAETTESSLIVSATSDNQTLIPDANITLGGSGGNRTIDVLPADHQNGGPVTITISVSDGVHTVQTAFEVSITARNDAPVGLPVVTGTPTEDQTLTADVSGISDADGLGTFNYQWLRDGGIISGATDSFYVLSDADVAAVMSVTVAYVDGQGNSESLTSVATSAVANVNDAPTTSNSTPLDLNTDEENPTTPVLVSALLTHAGWNDVDAAAASGIAVINTVNEGGQWQYSTDGSTWTAISSVSDSSSLLLSSTTQLRFVPGDDESVTATLSYRAWDQTTGTASTNATPQFASTAVTGGSTAFDDDSRSVRAVVSDVADAPIIGNLSGDSLNYAEGDSAQLIDRGTAATVTDVDSTDFNGGNLTVTLVSGSDPGEDVLQIRNQGTAAGQIGISGFNVTFGGTNIGTFTGGSTGTPLRIDFNASATPTAAAALISNITFFNTDTANPTTGTRAVSFVLNDGNGGVSTVTSASVVVSRVNDRPVLTTPVAATVFEETRTTISGISLTDVDAGAADVTAQVSVTGGVLDVTLAGSASLSAGANGTSSLTVRGTLSEVNASLASLDYTGGADLTGVAADTLTVIVSDLGNTGTGGTLTDTSTVQIDITAVNDRPTFTTNSLSILEGGTVTLSAAELAATDVDSPDADLVFTVSAVSGGQFELASAPQIAVTSFLQSQITAGDVRFVHDGGELAPAYDVSVSDGALVEGPATATISFTNVNDAPLITGLGGDSISVVNDGVAVRIDTGVLAAIVDPETPVDYDTALLQIAQAAPETGDRVSLDLTGNITLSAGMTDGSIVRHSGTDIGTLSGVLDTAFDITFNGNSSAADVDAVLGVLQFESTSAVLGSRTVNVVFNDGDGNLAGGSEVSSVATAFISVAAAGDGAVSTDEDTTYTFVQTDFDFTGITGSGLQSIELLTLPSSGTLRYNGSAATVGQVISRLDIQNGLLTFEPGADENGFNYGTFDFQINNGKANVTILAGEASYYTLTGGALFHTEDILTNADNFGPSGTYASSFSLIGQTADIGPAYLNQGSILFNGYVPDGSWTPTELGHLDDWVSNGGVLISNSDSAGYDDVSAHFGLTVGGTATTTWLVDDTSSPIIDGPFGSVGPVGTNIRATGAISYYDSSSLAAGDLVIAVDSGTLEPTIVLRQHGSGWILFTGDEGIFRINMSGGGNVATSNDLLTANLFAWAADQVPATSSHTMNVSVLAQNDDPVNTGALPSTATVNEDQPTPINISGLDLFDTDASANTLTVTLTTQSGGQLSAIAGGGVSIGGSGSGTLTLDGSQADLNAFFDNPLNISFTSAADQNGLAADRISIAVTDNGNLGAGGGGQIDLGFIDVDIVAVNDAPTAFAPVSVSIVEETPTVIAGFSIADVDSLTDQLTVRLQAINGTLSLTLSGGAFVSAGSNASGDVTVTGTLSQLNTALGTLIYAPNADVVGTAADQIVMTVDDGGNNGSGGALQDLATIQVDVLNVNDEEVLAANNSLLVSEGDLAAVISQADLEVSDVDNLPAEILYTLTSAPSSGVLRVSGAALVDNDTFTQEDINAGRLTYDHNDAEIFFDQFSFTADDGSGTTVSGDFDILITPVNDNNPVITSDGGLPSIAVNVVENTLDVVNVDATDIDLPAQSITYVIAGGADAGLFTVNPGSGLVRFAAAPDFETVIDANGDNLYEVVVEAQDGQGRSAVQTISVTVTDTDEFDVGVLTDADSGANQVAENSAIGTATGLTVLGVDGDRSDTVTYALDNDAGGVFAIDMASGVVTLNAAIDRETDADFTITVRATSTDGSAITGDFLIQINDVDEFDTTAIIDTDTTAEVIDENVSVGTSVGIVAFASDADATNDTITYSLDDNAGGLLTIDPVSGVVTTAAAIDYESVGDRLNVVVRATSQDTSFTTAAWQVSVTDLDEFDVSPIVDSDTSVNAVNENAAIGSIVGVTAFSEDRDSTNSRIFYSLDDTAGGRFTIDSTTGVITTAAVLDFESGGASHDVIVRVLSDDTSTTTTIITIGVNDEDEFDVTPIVDTDAATEQVDENSAAGTAIGYTAFSNDADGSLNAVSYSLDDDAGGLFRIDGVSGQISTNAAIDYETTGGAASLTIRATSADGSTTTSTLSVVINDVNEFPASPITDTDSRVDQIAENTAIGTAVGITAFSEDSDGTTNAITYSLDSDAAGRFAIDSASGVITTAAAIDFESLGGPQTIVARATSADGSASVRTFTIAIGDTNDTPPLITAGQQFSVSEFAANSTGVGTVLATDADTVGTLSGWTITAGNTDGIFGIDGSTGQLTVVDNSLLNFEHASSYTLTLEVTDGVSTSSPQTILILVQNENDAPVLTASAFDINEHTATGTVVDTAVTFDEDAGETLTYSLQGPPDQAFSIDPASGVITVADPTLLDFEVRTSLTMTVQVEDSGGLTDVRVLTININDVNEVPTDIAFGGGSVDENSASGTTVAAASFTDVDAGDVPAWSLIDSAGGRFEIDAATGVIRVLDGSLLDFESQSTHNILVRVTDRGGLFYEEALTVTLRDVNEAPTAVDDFFEAKQLEDLVVSVAGVADNDFDIDGDTIYVILVSGPENGTLALAANGTFTYTPTGVYSGPDSFQYRLTDGRLFSEIATVEIDVLTTVTGDSGDKAVVIEPTTTTEPDEPTTEVEEDTSETEDSEQSDTEQTVVSATSSSASTADGGAEETVGVSASTSREILQRTSSALFVAVFLEEVPVGEGLDEDGRNGRGSRDSDAQRGGRGLPRFLFEQITTSTPLLRSTEFDISQQEYVQQRPDQSLLKVVMETVVVGSSAAVSTSVSVGYVVWLVRGGSLVTSVLSSIPIWQGFDPLPVLENFEGESAEDAESLESIVG